ncbi:MAG: hypothetical protein U9M90_03265 [Patescibacteria group bacterium]|nr:hypothetical protein [Patescibacteria group bacterium]
MIESIEKKFQTPLAETEKQHDDIERENKEEEEIEKESVFSTAEVVEKVANYEPLDEKEKIEKGMLLESMDDIEDTLSEGNHDTFHTLIAYHGLEELQKIPLSQRSDFRIDQLMDQLAEKIQTEEGFEIEEMEDIDELLVEKKAGVHELLSAIQKEKALPEEKVNEYCRQFEEYARLKAQVDRQKKEIFKQGESFYKNLSEKYFDKFISFFQGQGEKLDDSLSSKQLGMLKYLGDHNFSSKTCRVFATGGVVMASLMLAFKPDTSEASEFEENTGLQNDFEGSITLASLEEDSRYDEDQIGEAEKMEEGESEKAGEREKEIENESPSVKELEGELEKIETVLENRIDEMNIFAKLKLKKNIDKYKEDILALLDNADYQSDEAKKLIGSIHEKIRPILTNYFQVLDEINQVDQVSYAKSVEKIKSYFA